MLVSRFCGVDQATLPHPALASNFFRNDLEVEHDKHMMVSTLLKNISQNGNLPQIGMKIKNLWNHHPVKIQSETNGTKYQKPWSRFSRLDPFFVTL